MRNGGRCSFGWLAPRHGLGSGVRTIPWDALLIVHPEKASAAPPGATCLWKEHPAAFRFDLWRLLEGMPEERGKRSKLLNERSAPMIQGGGRLCVVAGTTTLSLRHYGLKRGLERVEPRLVEIGDHAGDLQ